MNNIARSAVSRVDADSLMDVLHYAKALVRHVHVEGVYVTRRCNGSNNLLVQIAVIDAVYDIYNSDTMGGIRVRTQFSSTLAYVNSDMTARERLWAILSDNEDHFVRNLKEKWHEANWNEDRMIFADDYKAHIEVNLVRMSTSSNFIQKHAVTFQPPLSEAAIWQLFDN